ncbi:VOC family protein [Pseudenhygromyxa sp. WMMC2535]|uniref:VOC family protein n=1 Tax=Pseudenhygromyxa sp. WMMC2535 TaxID=2712867 RepID=UPI001556C102|nr:VOC family protein [Pseudenhygromyxa sp. WMMC2535]NVB39303.1 VOC family protein [Pseudenhygromyxa sp. WMMC2535]
MSNDPENADERTTTNNDGVIGWHDLTVPDADGLRSFYAEVAGWSATPVSMGDYDDYVMKTADGTVVAGLCHARGSNAGLPAQWMLYIVVDDLDARLAKVSAGGGEIIDGPRSAGDGRMAVVRDPAGATFALHQAG